MKKRWNIIKNMEPINSGVFLEAETFGEIENQLARLGGDADFGYKEYRIQIYQDTYNEKKVYRAYVTNAFTDNLISDEIYNSVEDLVMNFKLPDGLPFIDFMMTPAEQFK